jgi:alanyl-tRNA synthetase
MSEGAVAQGIRRIEAVTGTGAIAFVRAREDQLERAGAVLKAPLEEVASRLELQTRKLKDLQKETARLNFELIKGSLTDLIAQAPKVNGTVFIAQVFDNVDMDTLRRLCDLVRQKCPSVLALLAATSDEDGAVMVCVSDDLVAKKINAGDIIKKNAGLFNGSGGGRPQMAQSGCKDPQLLKSVFEQLTGAVKRSLTA